jgi:UPF0755 protein
MPKPPTTPAKTKKKPKTQPKSKFPIKALLIVIVVFLLLVLGVLWASLFKNYPVEGKKQVLVISSGDTYSKFIDHLAKENKVNFPIILKIYQKFMIHDTMKAGVYEVTQGMSVRQVLEMLSNAENAQMNRILVTFESFLRLLISCLNVVPSITKIRFI